MKRAGLAPLRPGAALLVAALLLGGTSALARPALVIYPGSFDPVHNAHLAELDQALAWARARHPEGAEALVLPSHDRPVHRPRGYTFDADQREELLRRAVSGKGGVRVCPAFGCDRETYQQLESLAARYGGKREVYLLVGRDAYQGMARWRGLARVLRRMSLLVSASPEELAALPPPVTVLGLRGARYGRADGTGCTFRDKRSGRSVCYFATKVPPVRSREILVRRMAGLAVDDAVPPAVARALDRAPLRRAVDREFRRSVGELADKVRPILGAERAAEVARSPGGLRRLLTSRQGGVVAAARARVLASEMPTLPQRPLRAFWSRLGASSRGGGHAGHVRPVRRAADPRRPGAGAAGGVLQAHARR